MKIRALKKFEGIKDIERDVFPKEGDIWEVSKERANFLKEHGVIEFIEEKVEPEITINEEEVVKKVFEQSKPNKKKKHSKK